MRPVLLVLILALVAPTWLGCASRTTTVTTTETTECPDPLPPDPADPYAPQNCNEVRTETRITTRVEDRCHGVVSCTFVVVGEVVALPFRIAGAVLGFVL